MHHFRTLYQIIIDILNVDPDLGTTSILKSELSNGLYHFILKPDDASNISLDLPHVIDGVELVSASLTFPMDIINPL